MSQNKLFYFRPVARRKVIHLMIAGREKERERGEERKREREREAYDKLCPSKAHSHDLLPPTRPHLLLDHSAMMMKIGPLGSSHLSIASSAVDQPFNT
jgi:hypothetical protein